MDILYFLIPLALVLVGVLLGAFWWAVRSGQFDDLEGPAYSILMDDDDPPPRREDAAQQALGRDPAAAQDAGDNERRSG